MAEKRQPPEKQTSRRTPLPKLQPADEEKTSSNAQMSRYRIFVSYSRDDVELVEQIVNVLQENGLIPMWDRNFAWGHGFPDQIKNFIAHAHVFMPIITEASGKRGWVHQEIGYAMALNIPVLPLTKDTVPDQMLHGLQAIPLNDGLDKLKQQISKETFDSLVRRAQKNSRPLFESAEHHEERTMMIVEYATNVLELKAHGMLRQKGALSSMHIPDKPINHPVWKERFGKKQKSDFHCALQLQERLILERHARDAGCKLIINPYETYRFWGPKARKVRLKTLLTTLDSLQKHAQKQAIPVEVSIHTGIPTGHNLTIVGDWFAAESVSAELGKGYKQTIFTRHAPTVRSRIEAFDREIAELLDEQRVEGKSSVQVVTEEIEKILAGIKVPEKMY
ncbi:MAG: toll/interleukin-1 receptor domain-containing protein [Thermodesulfobacteriota bacterium]